MVGIILNPETGVSVKDVNGWQEIVHAINADFFDVVRIYFVDDNKRQVFDVYCDDIGRIKCLTPSVKPVNYPVLVGTVLIGKTDEYGEDLDLTPDDISLIMKHIHYYTPDPEDETKHFYILEGVAH